jgi:hypothetical protein
MFCTGVLGSKKRDYIDYYGNTMNASVQQVGLNIFASTLLANLAATRYSTHQPT